MLLRSAACIAFAVLSLPCSAAIALIAQSSKSAQAFHISGAALSSGADLWVAIEGAEPPGAMLLKVSGGRFKEQTPLAKPEGFLYLSATAARIPDGLLFSGIDYRGGAMVFSTDLAGARVIRVGKPPGISLVSVYNVAGELWIAGQSEQRSPVVARLNRPLEVEHPVALPQSGDSFALKIAKHGDAYYALTQSVGPPNQSVVWKLSPTYAIQAKQVLAGNGATLALGDDGIAVVYNKVLGDDNRAPTVDSLSFDLKLQWSTRLFNPRGTGDAPNILAVKDQWIVVGGDNDRTYLARLSTRGELLALTYDQNAPPRLSMSGYVLDVSNGVLSIVGSNLDPNIEGPRNYTIFSYSVGLQPP